MNACAMFGYWGLFTWIPAYLSLPVAEGGRGLDLMKTTTWLVVMGVGKWFGYVLFGFAADAFGRKRAYVAYLLVILVPALMVGVLRSWYSRADIQLRLQTWQLQQLVADESTPPRR